MRHELIRAFYEGFIGSFQLVGAIVAALAKTVTDFANTEDKLAVAPTNGNSALPKDRAKKQYGR
jgi:hypothetical protein